MIHPDTELRFVNEAIGMGVFARKRIPKGTITWVRDDLDIVIPLSKVPTFPKPLQDVVDKYAYRWNDDYILAWDLSRYMNHSCNPSCLGTYNFEIAVRDLAPGDELTDDYSVFCMDSSDDFPCACNSPRCRGRVRHDDPVRMVDFWDSFYLPAFVLISTVAQPLMPLVKETEEIALGRIDPSTILTHRQLLLGGD